MAQLSSLRDRLRQMVGNPTTTDVPNSELDYAITEAYKEIARKYQFHQTRSATTITTVASTDTYALPTGVRSVLAVWDVSGRVRLRRTDVIGRIEQVILQGITPTRPLKWAREGNSIVLMPTPDAAYDIRIIYRAEQSDLAGDSATPATPPSWDRGILQLARYNFYDQRSDFLKAKGAMDAYKLWVSDQPNDLEDEVSADPDVGVDLPSHTSGRTRLDFSRSD